MNYGKTIRKIRINKGLTQKEVASNIVSLSFYMKVEQDEHTISADTFFKILNKLTIEIDEFLFVHNDFKETSKKAIQKQMYQFVYNHDLQALVFLKEETEQLYQQNLDLFYLLISNELECIINDMQGHIISDTSTKKLIDYLSTISVWGHFETRLFTDTMGFFDIETTILLADSLFEYFRNYSNSEIHEQDILLALINLTLRCFDSDYLEEASYYLMLINNKQTNPELFYERNMYLFLTGIDAIKNNNVAEGREKALCSIQIFSDLDMKNSANKYQVYLDKHLKLKK